MGTGRHCLTGGETQLVEEPCSARPFSSGWVGDSVRVCGWGGSLCGFQSCVFIFFSPAKKISHSGKQCGLYTLQQSNILLNVYHSIVILQCDWAMIQKLVEQAHYIMKLCQVLTMVSLE